MLSSLWLILSGCGTQVTKTERYKLPSTLIRSYGIPEYQGRVWGDHYPYEEELKALLRKHNADKAALRKINDGG